MSILRREGVTLFVVILVCCNQVLPNPIAKSSQAGARDIRSVTSAEKGLSALRRILDESKVSAGDRQQDYEYDAASREEEADAVSDDEEDNDEMSDDYDDDVDDLAIDMDSVNGDDDDDDGDDDDDDNDIRDAVDMLRALDALSQLEQQQSTQQLKQQDQQQDQQQQQRSPQPAETGLAGTTSEQQQSSEVVGTQKRLPPLLPLLAGASQLAPAVAPIVGQLAQPIAQVGSSVVRQIGRGVRRIGRGIGRLFRRRRRRRRRSRSCSRGSRRSRSQSRRRRRNRTRTRTGPGRLQSAVTAFGNLQGPLATLLQLLSSRQQSTVVPQAGVQDTQSSQFDGTFF